MSAQIGQWKFQDSPSDREFFAKTKALLIPYGPDSFRTYEMKGIQIGYSAFHTTEESRREFQPFVLPSGSVLTWDGRLDNREELIPDLRPDVTVDSTDVSIVGAAIARWGLDCFPRIIGDWALSLWNPIELTLTLAKDFAGTRHLYYRAENNTVSWSTILDPLMLFSKNRLKICHEYIAGWLALYPALHLTPYEGIFSVPPSCFVSIRPESITTKQFWNFDHCSPIHCRVDSEYEEQFRTVFSKSVARRLRADRRILAHLSGGMDSSAIVCVADQLIASGHIRAPQIDTISYFSDTEPTWDEAPYFTEVERKRERAGCRIDVGARSSTCSILAPQGFPATPASLSYPNASTDQFADCVAASGSRVVLSGAGGDEFTGGVPTPVPELLDLIAKARLRALWHRLTLWSHAQRRPWPHVLGEAIARLIPNWVSGTPKYLRPPPWLIETFTNRNHLALSGYPVRISLFGRLPSFQENLDTLDAVRRQIASVCLTPEHPLEIRYPFLDRDLLSFLFVLPREQLLRPGQRRSLMKRALVGIVPNVILERKRKAFVSRGPFQDLREMSPDILRVQKEMIMDQLSILDANKLVDALSETTLGKGSHAFGILRTMSVETWLRQLRKLQLVHFEPGTKARRHAAV